MTATPGAAVVGGRVALARLAMLSVLTLGLAACEQPRTGLSNLGPAPERAAASASAASQLEIGGRLLDLGDDEAALKAFNASMLEEGVTLEALLGSAAANVNLGRLYRARTLLERATERYPDSAAARNNLGVVHYKLGDYPKARAAYMAAFALSSGERREVQQNLAVLDIAEERRRNGAVEANAADYYVVPEGGGVFKLVKVEETSS